MFFGRAARSVGSLQTQTDIEAHRPRRMDHPLSLGTCRGARAPAAYKIRRLPRRAITRAQAAAVFVPSLVPVPARGRAPSLLSIRAVAFPSTEGAAQPAWPWLPYPRLPTGFAVVDGFPPLRTGDRRRAAAHHIRETSGTRRNAGRVPDTFAHRFRCRKLSPAAPLRTDSKPRIPRNDKLRL